MGDGQCNINSIVRRFRAELVAMGMQSRKLEKRERPKKPEQVEKPESETETRGSMQE